MIGYTERRRDCWIDSEIEKHMEEDDYEDQTIEEIFEKMLEDGIDSVNLDEFSRNEIIDFLFESFDMITDLEYKNHKLKEQKNESNNILD